jgi:hypothetical protein
MGRAGPVESDPRKDSNENLIFLISIEFGFWQDLEKFFKEI